MEMANDRSFDEARDRFEVWQAAERADDPLAGRGDHFRRACLESIGQKLAAMTPQERKTMSAVLSYLQALCSEPPAAQPSLDRSNDHRGRVAWPAPLR